jgi:uncharacterized protein (TIGR02594 family)
VTEAKPVRIVPGFQTTVSLRGLPQTKLELEGFDVAKLSEAKQTVKLSGRAENIPSGTPYKIRWVIRQADGEVRRVMIAEPPQLSVSSDSFELALEVDALALQLFGEGSLSAEMQVEFPLCAPTVLEKGVSYANPLEVRFKEGATDLQVGSVRTIELEAGGVFEDSDIRLTLHESGDAELVGGRYAARTILWEGGDRKAHKWRVGCSTAEGLYLFDYQDAIEFGYTLEARAPGSQEFFTVKQVARFATVQRPRLTQLSLEERDGAGGFAYGIHQAFTWEANEKRDVSYWAQATFEGFDPDLPVFMFVTLWVEKPDGSREHFHSDASAHALRLDAEGKFEVQLLDFTQLRHCRDLTSASEDWAFYVVLRCASGGARPFESFIDLPSNVLPVPRDLSRDNWRFGVTAGTSTAVKSTNFDPESAHPIPATQLEYHTSFEGGVRWKLCPGGIDVEGKGIERSAGDPTTARKVWDENNTWVNEFARDYRVPAELIVATICTESSGKPKAVREEPGYSSDESTPNKVSPGLMQTLISTARECLKKSGALEESELSTVTREWLFQPRNSIHAGTSVILAQHKKTDYDPVLVACAYNAGGVYENRGAENRWKLKQFPIGTGEHADRYVKWFNDFWAVVAAHDVQPSYSLRGYFQSSQSDDPPWLVIAKQEKGVKEDSRAGKDNPRVIEYHQTCSLKASHDETAWCSAFVNWCMIQAGQPSTNSARAIDWKNEWSAGKDLGRPAYGSIGVIKWGSGTAGHVGFIVGKKGSDLVFLGGNQGGEGQGEVKLSSFSDDKIIGYMVPKNYSVPEDAYYLPEYTSAQVSAGSFAGTR